MNMNDYADTMSILWKANTHPNLALSKTIYDLYIIFLI